MGFNSVFKGLNTACLYEHIKNHFLNSVRKVYSAVCVNEELWFDRCPKPRVQPGFWNYSASDGVVGGGSFPKGKQTRFETDYSTSSSTELKNEWIRATTLTSAFIACAGTHLP